MKRTDNLCNYPARNLAVRMLASLLFLFPAASWLTSTAADAQTTRDWNQVLCRALGNCPSPGPSLFLQRFRQSQRNQQNASLGAFSIAARSAMQWPQRNGRMHLAFQPLRAFAVPGQRNNQSLLSSMLPPPAFTCPSGGTCWVGGASGIWSTSANWSNGEPTNTTNVLIDDNNANGQGASAVTVDIQGAQTKNLTVDGDDSLTITDNHSLTVNGSSVTNKGKLALSSGGDGTSLVIAGSKVVLSGGGTVTLTDSGSPQNFIEGAAGTDVLTNQETIQGSGNIGNGQMGLVNTGTIDADNADHGLTIRTSSGTSNTGVLEATKGSLLVLQGDVFNNLGGTIQATGGGAVQLYGGATIEGGTLTTDTGKGSVIETVNGDRSITLDGSTQGTLTNAGNFSIVDNSTAFVKGTINNTGTIALNSGGSSAILELSGNTTLSGGGTVTLTDSGSPQNFIEGAAGTDVLTNQETIQGSGNIGNGQMGFINDGTVVANGTHTLSIEPGSSGFTNNGTLQVVAGSGMRVFGGPFTNFAGTTLTGGTYNVGGTLEIDQLGNTGGEIVTNAANIILNGTSSSFVDAAGQDALSKLAINAKGASFTIKGGRKFTTAGKFTNKGTLTVGSATSKFRVHGSLTNFSTTTLTLTGGTYNLTGTLQFENANIVTNAANITLSGSSSRVISQTGTDALANFAVNNGNFTIKEGRNFTTAGDFTNSGVLTVGSSNSTFSVTGNLTNFSGNTLTGGTYNLTGTLQFNGANIVTNAANITLSGPSARIIDQNSNNALANLAASTGQFTINKGFNFTTAGNFTNAGSLTIGTGSMFSVGGLIQTSGTTTDDGTLTAAHGLTMNAGSLFGNGTLDGSVTSSGTVSPGDSINATGILTDNGTFTQKAGGTLDISIGGTTAGTKFDQLNSTTAKLNGTLDISLINGFVPTVGSTFRIMDYNSESGAFSAVNGLAINSSEHFTLTTQGTDLLLTVVSGALPRNAVSPRDLGLHSPTWFVRNTFGAFRDLQSLRTASLLDTPPRFAFPTSFVLPKVTAPLAPIRTVAIVRPLSNSGTGRFQRSALRPIGLSTSVLPAIVATPGNTKLWATPAQLQQTFRPAQSAAGAMFVAGSSPSVWLNRGGSHLVASLGGGGANGASLNRRAGFGGAHLSASSPFGAGSMSYQRRAATPDLALPRNLANSRLQTNRPRSTAAGFGPRVLLGGFSVPVSNHWSKPRFGFGVE